LFLDKRWLLGTDAGIYSYKQSEEGDLMNSTDMLLELGKAIAFQQKWRRITSFSYFIGASLSIVSAAAASVIAGLGFSSVAAIVAAAATVLTSLEKVLLFREKWSHHRSVESELEIVRLGYIAKQFDERAAFEKIVKIMQFYNAKMPMVNDNKTV
jgi:hypothetical protein